MEEPRGAKRNAPARRLTPPVFMVPWVIFSATLFAVALSRAPAFHWTVFGLGSYVSLVFIILSIWSGLPWLLFSLLTNSSSALALLLGIRYASLHPPTDGIHSQDILYCLGLSGNFLMLVLCCQVLLVCLRSTMVGSSAAWATKSTWRWQEDEAALMRFKLCPCCGYTPSPRQSVKALLQADLLDGRAHWSGEPVLDYAFYVANSHCLMGALFCHPFHPFRKLERLLVLLVLLSVSVYPAAAASLLGWDDSTRTAIQLSAIGISLLLFKIFGRRLLGAQLPPRGTKGEAAKPRMSWCSISWLAALILVAGILCGVCALLIVRDSANVEETLLENLDGIAYLMLGDLLLDQLLVYREGKERSCCPFYLGVWHLWLSERNDYVPAGPSAPEAELLRDDSALEESHRPPHHHNHHSHHAHK